MSTQNSFKISFINYTSSSLTLVTSFVTGGKWTAGNEPTTGQVYPSMASVGPFQTESITATEGNGGMISFQDENDNQLTLTWRMPSQSEPSHKASADGDLWIRASNVIEVPDKSHLFWEFELVMATESG